MTATELPTGTVTFLFTDIEGSAKLWEFYPGPMRHALADHYAILREAVESNRGSVFKTMGDAVCAAFLRPEDALGAALDSQRHLAAKAWPSPIERLRVRMGIHTGTAVESSRDYFGPTVNRVARLMSIGHGDQILVSSTSALLLRGVLPPETSLRDLGSHQLKDLREPETAFQVLAPNLRIDFPPLRSQAAVALAHDLPLQLTRFYGRDDELAALTAELNERRLVTLTGFGGVGKSRLAIEAGLRLRERFPDGAFLVELAPLADPTLVAPRVATTLGLPEQAGQLGGDQWIEALRGKRTLLIVDNCEHVLQAAGSVIERILQRCPDFRILATSREPLHVPGERVVRLAPLAIPPIGHDGVALRSIRDVPAVALFLDRVCDAAPDFSLADDDADAWRTVGDVCAKLDGIPLALELAAARVPALGLPTLARGLENRFRLLRGGSRTSLPRHQTLQATLEWSYDDLGEREQRVFDWLGVFAGTFTADAAAAVCSSHDIDRDDVLDDLSSLVDKSLVVAVGTHPMTRYRLLESTRAYALQRLTKDAVVNAARSRHAEYYQALSLQFSTTMLQAADLVAYTGGSGSLIEWFDTWAAELDNFRVALGWAIDDRQAVPLGVGMLANLTVLMEWLALNGEMLNWCQRTLAALGSDAPALEATVQLTAARMLLTLGAFHTAIPVTTRAVDLFRQLGATLPMAYALTFQGRALASQPGSREAADHALNEALEIFTGLLQGSQPGANQESGELMLRNFAALATAFKAYTIDPGDFARRRALLTEALDVYRVTGPEHFIVAVMLDNLSEIELEAGNYQRALDIAKESVAAYSGPGSISGYIWALNAAGTASLALGDVEGSRLYARELLAMARRIGSAPGLGMALLLLAAIEAHAGESTRAAGLLGAWETCAGKIDTPIATTAYLCDRADALVRGALGEVAVTQALAGGTRWTLDEAIEIAHGVAESNGGCR